MNTNYNSSAVRSEVATMQANTRFTDSVYSKKIKKDTLVIIGYVAGAILTLVTLYSLGLIPKY